MRASAIASLLLLLPCLALAGSNETEKNWPAWRGPLGVGVAPAARPPVEWSDSKNVKWKIDLPGKGHATPIVWGDKVFVQTAVQGAAKAEEDKPEGGNRRGPAKPTTSVKFQVMAIDRKTGKTLWEKTLREEVPHEGTHETGSFASPSPLTDGERIYAFFGSRGLYCLDMDGKVVWEKDLGKLQIARSFGEGASPALYGDTLIVPWDHEGEDHLFALNKKTGEQIWKVDRDEPTAWATPLILEVNGKPQVIVSATKHACGYDLKTGEQVWETGGMTANVIPSPVYADGMLYLLSGFRGAACKAIRLAEAKGDLSKGGAVAWTYDKNTPYVPSPLVYKDCLYFLDNNKAMLTCLNAKTGEKLYGPERLEGLKGMIYASIAAADDRVYIADRDGNVVVLKAGPKLEVLATNHLDDEFDASPVFVDEELFLRGKKLWCIGK